MRRPIIVVLFGVAGLLLYGQIVCAASISEIFVRGYYAPIVTDDSTGRIYSCNYFFLTQTTPPLQSNQISLDLSALSENARLKVTQSGKDHEISIYVIDEHVMDRECGKVMKVARLAAAVAASSQGSSGKNNAEILFRNKEGWGPCRSHGETCAQTTTVYSSGKVLLEGATTKEFMMRPLQLTQFEAIIRNSGVLTKKCPYNEVADYWAEYRFNIDGKRRRLRYPSCEAEIKAIMRGLGLDYNP